jgi:anthraniloyl-CoA monooxygenase
LSYSLKVTDGDLRDVLAHYEAVRSVEVLKIQNAARNSTEWFENVARYAALEPEQFAYSLLTRSQRISHENLRIRDPKWLTGYERWLAQRAGVSAAGDERACPPLLTPYTVRSVTLTNRVVVSPTLLYSSHDGVPAPFHMVHLGSRAMGGVGLVLTEATAVSPDGRMTPGCPGLWTDEQATAWKRITDFVHAHSSARIGVQLNHAGRRGSTQLGWEQPDHPLPEGNWALVSASATPYLAGISQVPRQAGREDLARIRTQFAEAARRAAAAGFDWLELQAAHGCLLSSFISPLTNLRHDEYGGSLENRLRFPLEVLAAVREAWPDHLPISVRISSTDWAEGGTTVDEAVEIARRLHLAGADLIDVSSGEVSPDQTPIYGRMYQTPMADRIRNEARVPTIAVGAITEADQINGIVASGRADLCALSRPYLANSAWLLHECAKQGWSEVQWPPAYSLGREQIERSFARTRI